MSIRSLLETEAARLRVQAKPALPRPQLPAVVARVCKRHDEGGRPLQPVDLARLIGEFRKATAANALDQFRLRQWRQVCWGMFVPPEPLAEQPLFLDALLTRLWDGPSRSLCRTLITVYLAQFNPSSRSMQRIAQALADLAPRWDWPWAERQQRFHLFEPDKAPLELAKHCSAAGSSLEERLEDAGIKGICRFCGMEAAAFHFALRLMRHSLEHRPASRSRPRMERTIAWYEKALAEGGMSAFQAHRAAVATVLLLPWQERAPEDALRERITEFLLKHFKDPRIHPENWLKVPEEATGVLRRWLTRMALEQFFEIVDQVAERGYWMFRRPFWTSYDKRNVIDDAWVVFGPKAQLWARSLLGDLPGYGKIDRPRLPDHCILLLRIGGLTIAEVSHCGKCRIWKDGNGNAPRLHSGSYRLREIEQGPDLEQVHMGSYGYTWQHSVAAFIQVNTGIAFDSNEWRPS